METPRVISRDKASQSGNHGELIVKADLSFCIPFFLLEKKKKRRKNRKNIENYEIIDSPRDYLGEGGEKKREKIQIERCSRRAVVESRKIE